MWKKRLLFDMRAHNWLFYANNIFLYFYHWERESKVQAEGGSTILFLLIHNGLSAETIKYLWGDLFYFILYPF